MSTQYTAWNCAFGATTAVALGTSYASGSKCAIQLATSSSQQLKLIEWGCSFSGTAAGTPTFIELVQNGTASTMSTAHSTTTVQPTGASVTSCPLTMSTTTTGYGNGSITSATPDKMYDAQQIQPTGGYVKQWPLGREPVVAVSKFAQVRLNTSATYTALIYVVFEMM